MNWKLFIEGLKALLPIIGFIAGAALLLLTILYLSERKPKK